MARRGRHPERTDGETLQDETDEAGNEARDEECADGPYRPAEVSIRKEAVIEEEDANLDESGRDHPCEEESEEALERIRFWNRKVDLWNLLLDIFLGSPWAGYLRVSRSHIVALVE